MAFIYELFFPEKDKLYIKVALPAKSIPTGIFYITRTKLAKKLFTEYADMK